MTEEIETQENKKLQVLRGELALLVVVLINSLGVVLMLYSGSWNLRDLQCSLRIFLRIFGSHTWHLDLYFPGTAGIIPDDHAEEIRRTISFQLCRWICIQRDARCT